MFRSEVAINCEVKGDVGLSALSSVNLYNHIQQITSGEEPLFWACSSEPAWQRDGGSGQVDDHHFQVVPAMRTRLNRVGMDVSRFV